MTTYHLRRIVAPTETLDRETRRYVRHAPRPHAQLIVGKRTVEVELTEADLIQVAADCLAALEKVRKAREESIRAAVIAELDALHDIIADAPEDAADIIYRRLRALQDGENPR